LNFRPSTRAVVSIVVVIVVLVAAAYVLLNSPRQANPGSVPSQFTVNGKTFGITYVATNETEWEAGLMSKKVTDTTTMLFIFPSLAVYPFWMYHVNSSLDIIWLNVSGNEGRVVYLAPDVPGCSGITIVCPNYTPTSAANFVIEAKGGFSNANGIGVGTTIQFG
jgi:uncharacterized membrane protein (UPF0127 family)